MFKISSIFLACVFALTLLPVESAMALSDSPTLVSAQVTPVGYVEMTFSKAMSAPASGSAGFAVTGDIGINKNVSTAYLNPSDNKKIILTLGTTVKGGESVWLKYTPGSVSAADGGLLGAINYFNDITNSLPHPALNTAAPPAARFGTSYSHTFTATGGTAPYTFYIEYGNLPLGLTLNTQGVVSGTPNIIGNFNIRIKVVDQNQAFDKREFTISVTEATANVCEIDGNGYVALGQALAAVQHGQTIKLLDNITYNSADTISTDGKDIEFDLNGKTLNASIDSDLGFVVLNGIVTVSGGGVFNLNATGAVALKGIFGKVIVTEGSILNVSGNNCGVEAWQGSVVTVTNATGRGSGSYGAYSANGGRITVTQNSAGVMCGIHSVGYGSQITVENDALGTSDSYSVGVYVADGASARVEGNAKGKTYGVYTQDNARANIGGNAEGWDFGAHASSTNQPSVISVAGNVIATNNGVRAAGSKTDITVGGNVIADTLGGVGAYASAGGKITIHGTVSSAFYIRVGDTFKVDGEWVAQTNRTGFHTYSDGVSTVWVNAGVLALNCVEISGGNVTAVKLINKGNNSGTCILAIAIYNNRLLTGMRLVPITNVEDAGSRIELNGNEQINVEGADAIKVMLWHSSAQMRPLCEPYLLP